MLLYPNALHAEVIECYAQWQHKHASYSIRGERLYQNIKMNKNTKSTLLMGRQTNSI